MTTLVDLHRMVEHSDTDAGGVVHFSRYASLLETAVLENLERLGVGVRRLGDDGLELAISQLQLNYFAPARFYDELRIRLQIDQVGGASWRVSGAVYRGEVGTGTLLAHGSLVLCVVDRTAGTAVPLPGRLRATLAGCVDGGGRD